MESWVSRRSWRRCPAPRRLPLQGRGGGGRVRGQGPRAARPGALVLPGFAQPGRAPARPAWSRTSPTSISCSRTRRWRRSPSRTTSSSATSRLYNVRLRDDKNHPYLKLTLAEEYPRLYIVRRPGEDGNVYGGPYIPASMGRKTAGLVRKLFGDPLLQGDAERTARRGPACSTRSSAASRPAWPRSARSTGTAQSCEDARLFLEGRTEEVREAPPRRDGARRPREDRFEEAATPARPGPGARAAGDAAEDHDHRPGGARPLRAPAWRASGRRSRSSRVRDGKVVAREGYLLDRLAEPERVLAAGDPAVLRAAGRYVPARGPGAGGHPGPRAARGLALARRRGTQVRIRVPQRGEKVRLLELVVRNARLAFDLEWKHPRRQSQEILRALRDLLDLEVEPRRIECFDISNIQGSDIVASMVVFEDGPAEEVGLPEVPRPQRVGARPTTSPPCARWWAGATGGCSRRARSCPTSCSSTGARASSGRRWRRSRSWVSGDQPVASLAKREELIFVRGPRRAASPCRAPRPCSSSCSACGTRPIASRSASTARRARSGRCTRSWTTSPAWVPSRRRKLLSRFGSLRGVRAASEAELAAAVGKSTAARVRGHFER